MFLAINLPFPIGIALNGDKVCDNKLRWCGDKGGIPGPRRPPRPPLGGWWGPRSPRFTGRPSWLANKGTEIPWLLLFEDGGCGARGIDPKGAAPGGKSCLLGRAPTGGLHLCCDVLRALGIARAGGTGPGGMLWPLFGGVALLFRSLFSLFCWFLVGPEVWVLFAATKGGIAGEAHRTCGRLGPLLGGRLGPLLGGRLGPLLGDLLFGPLLAAEATVGDSVFVGVVFISVCNEIHWLVMWKKVKFISFYNITIHSEKNSWQFAKVFI